MNKHYAYLLLARLTFLSFLPFTLRPSILQSIERYAFANPRVSLDNGLIAYYPFEGDAEDSSGLGNHGVIHNATFTSGKFGQGLELTGEESSYVEVSHSASLETPDAVTISAWAKVYSNLTTYSALVYKAGEVPTSSGFQDRVFTLWVRSDGGVHLTSTPEGAVSQTICDADAGSYNYDVFNHFAGVVDTVNHVMSIYINGSKVVECPYPDNQIRGGVYPMRIGGYFNTLGDQSGLTGIIDDVRIYNRALSDAEVLSLFHLNPLLTHKVFLPIVQRDFTGNNGLIAYYPFEGDAEDSSGLGNHGVIHNATFISGKFGQGLELTGEESSYVEVPHSTSLETPDAVTISTWAKVYSNLATYSALVYKAGEVPTSSGFQDRVFTLWVRSDGGVHLTSTPEGAVSQTICDADAGSYNYNVFNHFAGVVDTINHVMSIYVNGSKVVECPYPDNQIRGGVYPMRIGGYFNTLGDQSGLTGIIDDVRIYNRALSDAEVLSLYNNNP